jgi:putative endonuclease
MGAFVYMLRCADDSYYVGSATGDDLTKRIAEHQSGAFPGYTWSRRPVTLIWSEHFDRITDAIAAERKIKGWSRAKKQALVDGKWESVQLLSRRRAGRPRVKPSS